MEDDKKPQLPMFAFEPAEGGGLRVAQMPVVQSTNIREVEVDALSATVIRAAVGEACAEFEAAGVDLGILAGLRVRFLEDPDAPPPPATIIGYAGFVGSIPNNIFIYPRMLDGPAELRHTVRHEIAHLVYSALYPLDDGHKPWEDSPSERFAEAFAGPDPKGDQRLGSGPVAAALRERFGHTVPERMMPAVPALPPVPQTPRLPAKTGDPKRDRKIRQVERLIAKANGTDSEPEARACVEKARQLLDELRAPEPNEARIVVCSDSGGTVIIDGHSDMFRIAATGTITTPAVARGTASQNSVTIATGLTIHPSSMIFVQYATGAQPTPYVVWNYAGTGVISISFDGKAQCVNTNETRVTVTTTLWSGYPTDAGSYSYRYYVLQQVAF